MAVGECDATGYDLRTRRQGLRSSCDSDVKRLEGSHFHRGHPGKWLHLFGRLRSLSRCSDRRSPEDLVAGLMETAERDFRRGLAQELVAAEKATDDDIAAEIDKFKPRERPGQQVVGAVARDPEAQANAAGPPIG